jgi:N6-L-threonylcarbamoyladenine synthase
MLVLGIETTCDETAAAVVYRGADGAGDIRSNVIVSQLPEHRAYGGVVPEIAARAHVELLDGAIESAMDQAKLKFADLDAIAAAAGPGLIGGLIVGLTTAKALALVADKPLLAINHLEAHALTARLTHRLPFPYLLLLVSGGHCQLLFVEGVGRYRRLATTIDDAAGEAFDKVARLLGLGYPGGPALERLARDGDPQAFDLPVAMSRDPGLDFSFSGLKTSLAYLCRDLGPDRVAERRADLAASFQAAAVGQLAAKLERALSKGSWDAVALGGGVAANRPLRKAVEGLCMERNVGLKLVPIELCTDNAAMIGSAARFAPRIEYPDYLSYDAFATGAAA